MTTTHKSDSQFVIPEHLKKFTVPQNYSLYTPIDQASWRYIMRVSKSFFKDRAHEKYLEGLPATGISIDSIPKIENMNQCLKKIGFQAAVVSGFIPPAVFLEFLSLGILPIACDMRTLEHISYTPAPDIVHEAAGHAPFLADPGYANYIRRYGEVSQKVIFTLEDIDVYNAIRVLSDIKEDPRTTDAEIEKAYEELDRTSKAVRIISEATLLTRMAWWTIEYGLVGGMHDPKVYGAGLLSSVGESYDCFAKNVKKVPLTLACTEVSYDITKPQPQLFVTPSFHHLTVVLEEFAETMAYKKGGLEGLEKALEARTVTTAQWDTGVEVSGCLENIFVEEGQPIYLVYGGLCQLSVNDYEVHGYGPDYLDRGLEFPVGPFQKKTEGQKTVFEYANGLRVTGRVYKEIVSQGILVAYHLQDVEITGLKQDQARTSASREDTKTSTTKTMDQYLLPVGSRIVSVFGEPADRSAYYKVASGLHEPNYTQKTTLTEANKDLNQLYLEVRQQRESNTPQLERLKEIYALLVSTYPKDWLLRLEILELLRSLPPTEKTEELVDPLELDLEQLKKNPEFHDLILRGLQLLEPTTH